MPDAYYWVILAGPLGEKMKRPALVKIVAATQLLIALLTLLWSVMLFRSLGPAAAFILASMFTVFTVAAVVIVVSLFNAYGIWRRRLWGWWLSLVADLMWPTLGVAEIAAAGSWKNIDVPFVPVAALSLPSAMLLLLPSVRRFYREYEPSPPEGPTPSEGANGGDAS
jgi:uncharacterized membrane protein (DUF2068 family)